LASKLRTPLQIQHYLTLSLEVGYQAGEQTISADLVESVLSKQLEELEPTLTRHGYRVKDLVEQFDAKASEVKALFNNQLDPSRTAELRDRMLRAGLPI
jgi:N-acetyl-anhydromuramyl-L-alanine amidase AmpD